MMAPEPQVPKKQTYIPGNPYTADLSGMQFDKLNFYDDLLPTPEKIPEPFEEPKYE